MRVSVEDVGSVKKILHIEVPAERVDEEWDKVYRTVKAQARIKGFRPGKIPRAVIENRFKSHIDAEVSTQLMQDSFTEALKQAALEPIGQPVVDRKDLARGKPYEYTVSVEVKPQIPDLPLTGLKLKKLVFEVLDDDVDAQIKILQKRNATLKAIDADRPVAAGDFAVIDYEGFVDGKPLKEVGKTENFLVNIGAGSVIKSLEDQLVGMHRDSTKEIVVPFPKDYFSKPLAGRDVMFKVTLKDIKEQVLPDLDDEFAKDLGAYKSMDELRQSVRNDLTSKFENESKRLLRKDIVSFLQEHANFELPEGIVRAEMAALGGQAKVLLRGPAGAQDSASVLREATDEALAEKCRPLAEKRVQEVFLLQKAIEQCAVSVSDERLDAALQEIAASHNQSFQSVRASYQRDEEAMDLLRQRVLDRELMDWIVANAKVESVAATKDMMNQPGNDSLMDELASIFGLKMDKGAE